MLIIKLNSSVSATLDIRHETSHAQNDKTYVNVELLLLYPAVAADALLVIGTAIISAVLSLEEHLSQTNTSVSRNVVNSRCTVIFGIPSQDTYCYMHHEQQQTISSEVILGTNTCYVNKYTMSAFVKLLRN
jgi:hypothetical protein